MAAGWAIYLWNEWSIQILIVLSFNLQLFIFLFAGMRRGNSRIWTILLWPAYLLADTTAVYTLGHISNSQLPELRPAAFWAQFLLLHLGGQDTMTAYAIEDNQLWLRHLLTLVFQALGAAYVLYRHVADSGTLLVMAAVLIYLVGLMKYGERVWTLRSSSHEGITNFLDNAVINHQRGEEWAFLSTRSPLEQDEVMFSNRHTEAVLRDAHFLLRICIGQFVDYKIRISDDEKKVITKYCTDKDKLFELTGMQLSLMHDIFYTKAVVIHTWYGCCIRVVSLVATVTALLLFRLKTGKDGYTRADVAVTYTLLGGAIVLEMTSILRAIGSSWTCAIDRRPCVCGCYSLFLHVPLISALMLFRRQLDLAARGRMWSGSVGQHNLLEITFNKNKQDFRSRIARITGLDNWLNKLRMTGTVRISGDSKALVLEEVRRIVEACGGSEDRMWSYRGQISLRALDGHSENPIDYSLWCMDTEFDESIIAWHIATNSFLWRKDHPRAEESPSSQQLKDAIQLLSNYMMFLLVDHPYMLPSPVRARQYDLAYRDLLARHYWQRKSLVSMSNFLFNIVERQNDSDTPAVIRRAQALARILHSNSWVELERVVLGVWVEMLCYAASHCSRESHAKHLNSGAQLITVIWILQTTLFNSRYAGDPQDAEISGAFAFPPGDSPGHV